MTIVWVFMIGFNMIRSVPNPNGFQTLGLNEGAPRQRGCLIKADVSYMQSNVEGGSILLTSYNFLVLFVFYVPYDIYILSKVRGSTV